MRMRSPFKQRPQPQPQEEASHFDDSGIISLILMTGVGIVIAFVWNFPWTWQSIGLFLIGGSLYMLAKASCVSRPLPPMMAKVVNIVVKGILGLAGLFVWFPLIKPVVVDIGVFFGR